MIRWNHPGGHTSGKAQLLEHLEIERLHGKWNCLWDATKWRCSMTGNLPSSCQGRTASALPPRMFRSCCGNNLDRKTIDSDCSATITISYNASRSET